MEVEVSEYIRYINNNTEKWYCDFPTDYEEFPNLLYMYSVPKIFKIIPLHTIIQNYMNGSI